MRECLSLTGNIKTMISLVTGDAGFMKGSITDYILNAYADHRKAHKFFGILELTSLLDALSKMINWTKKTEAKSRIKFKNIKLTQKLPSVCLED